MNQKQQVLKHLKRYGVITTWTAITKYQITRLARCVHELREEGYRGKILTIPKQAKGKTWAEYRMIKATKRGS